MAKLAWSVLLPDVRIEVPGVSDPLAEARLRDAAIRFCRLSKVWVHYMDAVALIVGEAIYDWDIPAGTLVTAPLEVWLGGKGLTPASPADLSALYGDWRAETGTPLYYLNESADGASRQVTLVPEPDTVIDGGLTARLALRPTRDAADIDEIVIEEYGPVIVDGALGALYLMTNKPWSNPDLGQKLTADFERACAAAHVGATKGHSRAPLRTRTTHGIA